MIPVVAVVLGGAVVLLALRRPTSSGPAPSPVGPAVCTGKWVVPTYAQVPKQIVSRSVAILRSSQPLNTDLVENINGVVWKFHVRKHPPNSSNPVEHRGVDVERCVPSSSASANA